MDLQRVGGGMQSQYGQNIFYEISKYYENILKCIMKIYLKYILKYT